jgi:hypothetical protein
MKVVVDEVDRIGMKADFKIVEVVGGSSKKKAARKFSKGKPSGNKGDSPKGSSKGKRKYTSNKKTARKNTRRRRK